MVLAMKGTVPMCGDNTKSLHKLFSRVFLVILIIDQGRTGLSTCAHSLRCRTAVMSALTPVALTSSDRPDNVVIVWPWSRLVLRWLQSLIQKLTG